MFLFERRSLRFAQRQIELPFCLRSEVRMAQVDAAGIVFFARFFEYFHEVYEQVLTASGEPLSVVLKGGLWAAPLRHTEADYISPLRLGDSFFTQIVAIGVQPTEMTLAYQVLVKDAAGEFKVSATGQTVHTFVSPVTFQRSEVAPRLLKQLRDIQDAGGHFHQVQKGEESATL